MQFMVTLTCTDLFVSLHQQCVCVCASCRFLCVPVMILLCSNIDGEKMLPALQKSSILSFPKQGICGILTFL